MGAWDTAGNLGIGTTSPGAGVDVQVGVTAASGNAFGVRHKQTLTAAANNDALNALYIDPTFADSGKTGVTHNGLIVAAGNVGIGTTSPGALLDVNGFARFKVPAARVTNSSSQSLTSGNLTVLNFDTNDFDNDSLHNTVTNNTRLTAPEAGIYCIGGQASFNSNNAGTRSLGIGLNGTTQIAAITLPPCNGEATEMIISTLYQLSANDYVELDATQDCGAALSVNYQKFWMYKVSR